MIKPEDIMNFKAGKTHKAHIPHLGDFRKIHVVSVVDEGLSFCPMVVYRYFGKIKRVWFYEIENAFTLTSHIHRAQYAASKCIQS